MISNNHKKIAGRINKLKNEIANINEDLDPNDYERRKESLSTEAAKTIEELRSLIKTDHSFSSDSYMNSLPDFYKRLLEESLVSRTISEAVIDILSKDEAIFNKDFSTCSEYKSALVNLYNL